MGHYKGAGHSSKEIKRVPCRYKNPKSAENCRSCGKSLRRGGLIYWIEYNFNGRKREKIGPSKAAAELRESEVKKNLIENRQIKRDQTNRIRLSEAIFWYLNLKVVQAKKSYKRDEQLLVPISRILGPETVIGSINFGMIENYRVTRLNQESKYNKSGFIRPATVNKEVSALTTMLNRMVDHEVIDQSPIKRKISKLEEDNIRNKSLTHMEFKKILESLKSPLTEMTMLAYYTAMRQGEIMKLQWEQVDLERGIITVKGIETKNSLTKFIPIHPELNQYLNNLGGFTKSGHVVQSNGKELKNFSGNLKNQWNMATMNVGIKNLRFHDMRHVATNKLRKSVIDPIKLNSITGHKSDRALNRYIFVDPDEMKNINWNFG